MKWKLAYVVDVVVVSSESATLIVSPASTNLKQQGQHIYPKNANG